MDENVKKVLKQVICKIHKEVDQLHQRTGDTIVFSFYNVIDIMSLFDNGQVYKNLCDGKNPHEFHSYLGRTLLSLGEELGFEKLMIDDKSIKCYTPRSILGTPSAGQLWKFTR